jgi:ectoine hydroxylase-related dioxygenase (phytanoyl-CoA dioxygenase family)
VSLDASTAENGPLRVLPDTHQHGVLDDDEIARYVRQTAPIDCLTAVGGVVAMRPLTVHASSKSISRAQRRVVHIEYAASLTLAKGVELAFA